MFGREQAVVEAAVLEANAGFYAAFSAGDVVAMAKLWAEDVRITCLHPGSPLLVGRDAVLESWRVILREAPSSRLRCDHALVSLLGELAIVTGYEAAGEQPAHLAATNVFVNQQGAWRMVHHHAGPLSAPIRKPSAASRAN